MPPMEAIRSATVHAADLLGVTEILGSIEKGKLADIIAIEDNPLENIETLLDVPFVMKTGRFIRTSRRLQGIAHFHQFAT